MSSNDRRSIWLTDVCPAEVCSIDKAFEFVLVTDKLLQFAVTLCIYHIGGWRVANLIWIVRLVGFDIPQLPHVLHLLLRPHVHCQAFYLGDMCPDFAMNTGTIHANEYPEVV